MNPYDELGEQPEYSKEDNASFEKRDNLIHRVFAETEAGQELLKLYVESMLNTPADNEGTDLFSLGKEEGRKTFMRNIITTIRKVEQ